MNRADRADRVVRRELRSRVLITTKTGQTWSGLLLDADTTTLVLADARLATGPTAGIPADGRVFLSRVDVAYMQLT